MRSLGEESGHGPGECLRGASDRLGHGSGVATRGLDMARQPHVIGARMVWSGTEGSAAAMRRVARTRRPQALGHGTGKALARQPGTSAREMHQLIKVKSIRVEKMSGWIKLVCLICTSTFQCCESGAMPTFV